MQPYKIITISNEDVATELANTMGAEQLGMVLNISVFTDMVEKRVGPPSPHRSSTTAFITGVCK